MGDPDLSHGHVGRSGSTWTVRITTVASTVGCSLLCCLAAAASFLAFLVACAVGLAVSAGSGTIAERPGLSVVVAILAAAGSALMVYLPMHWRARSAAARRWYTAAVLGAVAAVVCGVGSFVEGYLLTGATWGRRGADFFEHNRIVNAAAPAWQGWHFLLLCALIAIYIVIGLGPSGERNGKRRYRWYVYVMLAAVPAASLGALVTTAMLDI